jgi:hypothetical protein
MDQVKDISKNSRVGNSRTLSLHKASYKLAKLSESILANSGTRKILRKRQMEK